MNTGEITSISGIVGIFMPFIVDFVNLHVTSSTVRYVLSLIASFIAAFLITYLSNQFDVANLLASLGVVFAASQTIYKMYWDGSNVRSKVAGYIAPESKLAAVEPKPKKK